MSATVPMEFQFGTGGNLKAAKRLRNLDLKKNRPAVHPLFGNTGSVVGNAYRATGAKGPVAAKLGPGRPKPASPLSPVGRIPIINKGIAAEQGSDSGGGQILPSKAAMNPVIPSGPTQVAGQNIVNQPGPVQAMKPQEGGFFSKGSNVILAGGKPQEGGFFSKGSNVILAGGGAIALIVILYMMFSGDKGKKRRRRVAAKVKRGRPKSRR